MQQNVKKWIWHSSCDVNYRMLKIVNVASFLWQNIILNNHWSCLLYTHLANQYRPVHLHTELHLNSFVLAVFFKYWHRLIFKAHPKILIRHCDISHLYLRWTKMLSLHIFVGCLWSQKKEKENNDTQLMISKQIIQSFMFTEKKKTLLSHHYIIKMKSNQTLTWI